MKKFFRGKWLNIKVVNETGSESGVKKLVLNDKVVDGDYIKAEDLADVNDIVVSL